MRNWTRWLIDKNCGAPRSKIVVRRVIDHLVGRSEVLRYQQNAADLEERVPIVVIGSRRAGGIERRIAGDEVKIIARIRGRRTASHPDSSVLHIGGNVEHSCSRQAGRVVPHDPAIVWEMILVRGPCDIDHPIDQGKGWALVLLAGDEGRGRATVARSRISPGDCYRTAGLLTPGEGVDSVESLEKGRAGRNH